MRILHTADWHLGDRLGRVDRTDDLFRSIERIAEYCDDYDVDVLLVAGDVIEDYHGETVWHLLRRLAALLEPCLRRGMHAVFIPGNHDREYLFGSYQIVQAFSGPEETRHIHFASQPCILLLPDPSGAFQAQFVLAPFPTAHRYLLPDAAMRALTGAERRAALARAYADKIASAQREIDPRQPAVLVTHISVGGADLSTRYRLSEGEDIVVEAQDLPSWAYVALGHIHRPQAVGGRASVRYAGSIDRLDGGERDDDKSCVLVDIGPTGLVEEPALLSLPATPIYSVHVNGDTNLDALAERYPDHDQALVGLRIAWRPGVDNPHALLNRLQTLFPRYYKLDTQPLTEVDAGGEMPSTYDPRDLASTVEAYLERRLADLPAEARERLVRLATTVIEEVGHEAAAR